MFNRIIMKFVIRVMKMRGYSSYFAPKMVKEFITDFKNTKEISLKQKIWAYKRGFFSSNIIKYNLNDDNHHNYLPDFRYYKLHPINGQYGKWIDDKLTMKYILSSFNDYLPKYYFHLKQGKIINLMDCPSEYNNGVLSVIKILKEEGNLAVKLITGSLGQGFYRLSYLNQKYSINEKNVSKEEVITFLNNLDNYTITEYLIPHKDIRKVYSGTANTLRVMLINDNQQSAPEITGTFIKFGTKKSGVIEHVWAGGVFCKVDLISGEISSPNILKDGNILSIVNHPDTDVRIEGYIPHWDEIKEKLIEISKYIPQVKYMGFDIVMTERGFKILEINSHQDINLMQVFYPLMENDYSKRFFDQLM